MTAEGKPPAPPAAAPTTAAEAPPSRSDYPHFLVIPTRWHDNDVYGHVNNVVYYAYFDTVLSHYLVTRGGLDYQRGPVIGICVESMCRFHRSIEFPDRVDAGLRVGRLGNSSVRYEIGLFREGEAAPAATGHFVHVFVDRESRRPVPIPPTLRVALAKLVLP